MGYPVRTVTDSDAESDFNYGGLIQEVSEKNVC